MANESEVTLKVKVDSKQAEKQVESLTKNFSDAFSSGTKDATKSFNSLFSTSSTGITSMVKGLGLATVAIGAVGFAVKEAFSAFEDIAKVADETNKINKQFDFLAEKAGDTGGRLRASFEEVNLGILDTEDILKSASVALTNLSIPTQDIAKNFEAARRTAIALGGDTIQNFEAINTAIASGNTRVLKQIGLFIDADSAVADYAASIGVAAKFLTDAQRQAAIFAAIQNKVNDSFSNVDITTKTTSESFQQFRTAVGDVGEAVAIALNKIFGPSVSALLQKFSESLGVLSNEILSRYGDETEKAAATQQLLRQSLEDTVLSLQKEIAFMEEKTKREGVLLGFKESEINAVKKKLQAVESQIEKEDILSMKQQQAADFLKNIDQEKAVLSAQDLQRLEARRLAEQALVDQTRAQEIANLDAKLAASITNEEIDRLAFEKQILLAEQNSAQLEALDAKFKAQNLTNTQAHIDARKALEEKGYLDSNKIADDADKKKKANADKIRQEELANQQAFFSAATSLQNSKTKELAAIGKAAAITEIAIKTPQAVASSFAFGTSFGGPVVGFILGAIAAAAMAAQAANVAGVGLATGITAVPKGFPNDTFPANLTSGERVLSVEQNKDLGKFLDSQESQSSKSIDLEQTNGLLAAIAERLGQLENTIIVNVGPREIMREVREGIRSGQQVLS